MRLAERHVIYLTTATLLGCSRPAPIDSGSSDTSGQLDTGDIEETPAVAPIASRIVIAASAPTVAHA